MKKLFRILCLPCLLLFTSSAHALYTELGLSYSYMKRTFSELDNIENQSSTFSLSFYLWEKVAIETSYTNGLYVKKEKESSLSSSTAQRITTQYSDVYEGNLIFLFADRKAVFQPFIKGGAAYIKKKQVVQIDTDPPFEVNPKPGLAPSFGVGARVLISENFAIRAGYDVIRTPVDDNVNVDDISGRVGLTWMF